MVKYLLTCWIKTKEYFIRYKKIINIASLILPFIAFIVTILTLYLQNVEASVDATIIKYEDKGIILYGGRLKNTSNIHADKLTFVGNFSESLIRKLDIDTTDHIEYKNIDHSKSSVQFCLRRLSRSNGCNFNIIVKPRASNSVKEKIQISWGKKGREDVIPQSADEETIGHIKRGMLMNDLSHPARRDWVNSNTRNVR